MLCRLAGLRGAPSAIDEEALSVLLEHQDGQARLAMAEDPLHHIVLEAMAPN